MKHHKPVSILLTVVAIWGLSNTRAQMVTISEARTLPSGSAVTIANAVVINTVNLAGASNRNFHVRDSTGAAAIFGNATLMSPILEQLSLGAQISFTATTGEFNDLFEFRSISLIDVVLGGEILPPMPVTPADLLNPSVAESFEGDLVEFLADDYFFAEANGLATFQPSTNYTLTNGVGEIAVRIMHADLDLVGQVIPTGPVTMTAVLGQYRDTYQLMPRTLSDITAVPEPGLISLLALAGGLGLARIFGRRLKA